MKENLQSKVKVKRGRGEIEISLFKKESEANDSLDQQKRQLDKRQYGQDKRELKREDLRERLKHHQDAVKNLQAEIAALEKDMKEDESDVAMESGAAMTKTQYDKIDTKELKRDDKKQKKEHEKDAIRDDEGKMKKLQKGKPSEKKDAEKKALKRDMKFDKESEEKMQAEMAKDGEYKGKPAKAEMSPKQKGALDKNKDGKITKEDFEMLRKGKKKADGGYGGGDMKKKVKPKKSYAQMLMDIAAERYGGKKRSELKDSDFLDPKRRSFPVMSAQDVKDAVSSWGRYKGSMTFDEFKAKLIKRAKKIGAESALPKTFTEDK